MVGIFQYQHELVDRVYLVLDVLDEGTECIGDVIDERVRDPIGCDIDVVLELFDTASHILRMRCASEMELNNTSKISSWLNRRRRK